MLVNLSTSIQDWKFTVIFSTRALRWRIFGSFLGKLLGGLWQPPSMPIDRYEGRTKVGSRTNGISSGTKSTLESGGRSISSLQSTAPPAGAAIVWVRTGFDWQKLEIGFFYYVVKLIFSWCRKFSFRSAGDA